MNERTLRVWSDSFAEHERIPDRHTGVGEDVSPALAWSGVPNGTRSLVVICHDPDAPRPDGHVHWVVTGISPAATGLEPGGNSIGVPALNGWGEPGYRGPIPPAGHGIHHYYFWVYAVGARVDGVLTRRRFLDRFGDAILDQARTVGTFSR